MITYATELRLFDAIELRLSIRRGRHADYVYASTEFFCPQIITDYHRFLNIKDILIITDYYHQSLIINQSNQSLWLLICVNLCQSVVYKKPALTSRVYTLV